MLVPLESVDSEGWSYGTNFSSRFQGSSHGGLKYFVRWRRLMRKQLFLGKRKLVDAMIGSIESCSLKVPGCFNVDVEAIPELGRTLVDALTSATFADEWCLPSLVTLKHQLAILLLSGEVFPQVGSAKSNLESFLNDTFVSVASSPKKNTRGSMRMSLLSSAKPRSVEVQDEEQLQKRLEEVEELFGAAEMEAYATLAMWRFSPNQCCSEGDGPHECRFEPVSCKNDGCDFRCSAYALSSHEDICGYKVISCESCGETIRRRDCEKHMSVACPNRPAACNFACIGCNVVCTHRSLSSHLEECTQSHLLQMLDVIRQQQDLTRMLSIRVQDLEKRCTQHDSDRILQTALAKEMTEVTAKVNNVEVRLADAATKERQDRLANAVGELSERMRAVEDFLRNSGGH